MNLQSKNIATIHQHFDLTLRVKSKLESVANDLDVDLDLDFKMAFGKRADFK